jgi:hypothetical protein
MPTEPSSSQFPDTTLQGPPSRTRVRFGLIVTLLGFFILIVGTKPAWFGWDNSPTVGFIQVSVLLVGLGILCVGGYIGLLALWKGKQRTIAADIGMRLVATGYVVSVFAGMADLFGMGTQIGSEGAFFGPLQSRGIVVGQIIIALGFLLVIPFRQKKQPE